MLLCATLVAATLVQVPFPAPFTRPLHLAEPPMRGDDIVILQHLLQRAPAACALRCNNSDATCSGVFDVPTSAALACFLEKKQPFLDVPAAQRVLSELTSDGWIDDGTPAAARGYKYKLLVPVHRNRSIETLATLLDGNNTILHRFRVRAHGHDADADGVGIDGRPWPDLSDTGCPHPQQTQGCVGLNMLSSSGATPTGLSAVDLNSPEDAPRLYGPYPVNRWVRGLAGNAAFLLPHIRNGILLHTGAWGAASGWRVGEPMPNSAGCVHAYPQDVHDVWRLLVERCKVEARPNSNGRLPYPYAAQGLAAVFEVGA